MYEINRAAKRFLTRRVVDYVIEGIRQDINDLIVFPEEEKWVHQLVGRRLGVRGLFHSIQEENTRMLPSLILFKDSGQVIPREVIEEAIKGAKALGMATVDENAIVLNREIVAPKLDPIVKAMEMFKDEALILSLDYTGINDLDLVQPFPIFIDENKSPTLIAFIQGDTSVLDKVKKKFQKVFKSADTYEEFWKDITEDEDTTGEIKSCLAADSALVIMNNVGEVVPYETSDIEKNYPWGSSYGAPEATGGGTPVEVQPADAPKRSLGSMSGTTDTTETVNAAAAARTDGVPVAIIASTDIKLLPENLRGRVNESGTVVFKSNSEAHMRCPEIIDGRRVDKDMNHRWHKENFRVVPTNWKDKPRWPISFRVVQSDVDLKNLKTTTSTDAIASKDLTAKHIPANGVISDKDAVSEYNEFAAKIFGTNAEEIGNPAKIRDNEKNLKPIYELIGKESVRDVIIPRIGRLMICTQRPDLAERFWGDVQNAYTTLCERVKELEENVQKQEKEIEELTKPKPKAKSFGSMG